MCLEHQTFRENIEKDALKQPTFGEILFHRVENAWQRLQLTTKKLEKKYRDLFLVFFISIKNDTLQSQCHTCLHMLQMIKLFLRNEYNLVYNIELARCNASISSTWAQFFLHVKVLAVSKTFEHCYLLYSQSIFSREPVAHSFSCLVH